MQLHNYRKQWPNLLVRNKILLVKTIVFHLSFYFYCARVSVMSFIRFLEYKKYMNNIYECYYLLFYKHFCRDKVNIKVNKL